MAPELAGSAGVVGHPQVAWAAQHGAGPVGRRFFDQSGVVEPADQRGERLVYLQPGEGSAKAVVQAAPEAQVLVVRAVGVEPVGVGEPAGIAAGGGEQQGQLGALRDGGARRPARANRSAPADTDTAEPFLRTGGGDTRPRAGAHTEPQIRFVKTGTGTDDKARSAGRTARAHRSRRAT